MLKQNKQASSPFPKTNSKGISAVICFAVAIFIVLVLGGSAEPNTVATLRLTMPTEKVQVPNLVLNVRLTAYFGALAFVVCGFSRLGNRFKLLITISTAVSITVGLFAFLAWAAAGRSFNLTGMITATVSSSVPIALAALSGILWERAGVINIAIEGMLLIGAFVGAVAGSVFNPVVGLLLAILAGGLMAWLLGVLVIQYSVDQVIAGFVATMFAMGLTSFLTARFLTSNSALNNPKRFMPLSPPLITDVPILGQILRRQNLFFYGMVLFVVLIHYGISYTRWGLRLRAVGEHPKAADTAGINVLNTRYLNVVLGGMLAGFGGAFFTLGSVGRFNNGMTAGRGYIGLAAMIFGNWRPAGAFSASLLFGFADSLQQKLAILNTPIPSEFLLMAPYVVTVVVVAGVIGNVRGPAALGKPYKKE